MATINGSSGDDTLNGTSGDDELNGFAGSDTLNGVGGNDTLYGGDGYDFFYGGAGDDVMFGGSDTFDDFYGGDGNDTVYAGDFDNNWIYGGDGNDVLFAGAGFESIEGNAGDDSIYAGAGNDSVLGGTGDDLIQGQEGNDTLFGGDGADTFEVSDVAATDTVFGGSGATDSDTLRFVFNTDVSVTFSGSEDGSYTQNGGATAGNFEEIEVIETAGGDDTVDASASGLSQTIRSGAGNDTISGGADGDTIETSTGNDSISGGAGNDVIRFGAGDDLVFGGAGNDVTDDEVFATTGNNTVYGGDGNDLVRGGGGNDTLFGDAGNDTFESDGGNDTLYGGTGEDTLRSYGGNDTVYGGADNDSIEGGSGDDILLGDAGEDRLRGDAGNDTLTGGAGNDTFVFGRDGSDDTVTDFDMADDDTDGFTNDQLDVSALRDLGGDPVNVADVTVETGAGGFARLRFPEGETITLQGVTPAQASAPGALLAMGVPCFTSGTMIATPTGHVLIDRLKVGDRVVTRDNGPQVIRWIGKRLCTQADLRQNPAFVPVRIAPGLYDNQEPILVSQQHGILLRAGGDERLVRAKHLAALKGGKVRLAPGVRAVTYFHLLFEDHQIIFGDNIPSESFYPGPWGLAALETAQAQEVRQLFQNKSIPSARAFIPRRSLPSHLAELKMPAA